LIFQREKQEKNAFLAQAASANSQTVYMTPIGSDDEADKIPESRPNN
jgi:hypothetical protein